jgi:cytochrome c-type biogenesis protein CcmE
MSPGARRRLGMLALMLAGVSGATALALTAFRENMMYFYSPSDVVERAPPTGHLFRLGGLVEHGSIEREPGALTIRFRVTDTAESVEVAYTGLLPDLFREGQGVVTHGRLDESGRFVAQQVLAKHDEHYMAPEVKDSIERAAARSEGHPPLDQRR